MRTWNTTNTLGGYLLPSGDYIAKIVSAAVAKNERSQIDELSLELTDGAHKGLVTIPLFPWDRKDEAIDLWASLVKTQAIGLGFTPSDPNSGIGEVATQLGEFAVDRVGESFEIHVDHIRSKDLKDDGTPFVNHRVTFRAPCRDIDRTLAAV